MLSKSGIAKPHRGSPKTPTQSMAKRREHGLTYRQVASEHGVSKSTAHRRVTGQAMRQGFNRMGSAG